MQVQQNLPIMFEIRPNLGSCAVLYDSDTIYYQAMLHQPACKWHVVLWRTPYRVGCSGHTLDTAN